MEKSNSIEVVPMPGEYGRFIVIDTLTNKVLDDAQGYGYKSIRNAWAAWSYKNKPIEEKMEAYNTCKKVFDFTKSHRGLDNFISKVMLDFHRCGEKFTTKDLEEILTQEGFNIKELPFTTKDFLKYYGEYPEKLNPKKKKKKK